MTIAILGFGDRGSVYADLFTKNGVKVSAVCDTDLNKLRRAVNANFVSEENCFSTEEEFWNKGKTADLIVISTQDRLHYGQAIKAISLGYDVLLEKPIASSLKECDNIVSTAEKFGSKVYLCYVLRYAPFFVEIKKTIDSGVLGKIVSVNLTEGVGYWHQAHSFVRGNWRKSEESSPMIIAKCCHDTDILYWLIGSKVKAVSSMGSNLFFNEKNAPKGCARFCCDCKLAENCPYDNFKFYSEFPWWIYKTGFYNGDYEDKEAIKKCLADKNNPYSRCVFYCDNDVVDHQITNIEFANGTTAHLTMTGFTAECNRSIRVHGTYGEIYGKIEDNGFCLHIFGKEKTMVNLDAKQTVVGHGGGDYFMIRDIVKAYSEKRMIDRNGIKDALMSHYIGFAAEESRIRGGEKIDLSEIK